LDRPVVITGCGILSCHGDLDATWQGLQAGGAPVKRTASAIPGAFPYARVYSIEADALAPLEARHVNDRSHIRAMGLSMRYACVAAGMAIEHAGLKARPEILERAGLFVAARFGERDEDVDCRIAREIAELGDYEPRLNALLARELRPGLFLAQLPNLFAGNISLLYQLKGPSMTFLGEHGAGGCALAEAASSVADGSIDVAVVGGCYNAAEYQAHFALAGDGWLSPDRDDADARPVQSWIDGSDGTVPGAAAAFVTLESADHAIARGATIRAELAHASFASCPRGLRSASESLGRQYRAWLERGQPVAAFVGNGSGIAEIDVEELRFLHGAGAASQRSVLLTTPSPGLGDVCHAAFPLRVALAATAIERGELFGLEPDPRRRPLPERVRCDEGAAESTKLSESDAIGVVALGFHESESLAVLRRYAGHSQERAHGG
jgi:3-oxoacyl-[acyl-carrier-protein] synthase II